MNKNVQTCIKQQSNYKMNNKVTTTKLKNEQKCTNMYQTTK